MPASRAFKGRQVNKQFMYIFRVRRGMTPWSNGMQAHYASSSTYYQDFVRDIVSKYIGEDCAKEADQCPFQYISPSQVAKLYKVMAGCLRLPLVCLHTSFETIIQVSQHSSVGSALHRWLELGKLSVQRIAFFCHLHLLLGYVHIGRLPDASTYSGL